jgi:hypothetical protein
MQRRGDQVGGGQGDGSVQGVSALVHQWTSLPPAQLFCLGRCFHGALISGLVPQSISA